MFRTREIRMYDYFMPQYGFRGESLGKKVHHFAFNIHLKLNGRQEADSNFRLGEGGTPNLSRCDESEDTEH